MKHLTKILNCSACILILGLLTGCVPIPHTTLRSPEVSGRVLDARTRAAIQGAKVFLVQSPHHTTYTDTNGHFHMKATRNFHFAYNEGGGWPDRKNDTVEILHPNYVPHGFAAGDGGDIGDILLEPKQ
jgi:hypothetical protein